ncbi:MAG: KH domain-containing protein [Nanoarchaeota archaeon]|nr:KH domain-containing protein [Nanoarchaeota archaeon]
MDTKEIKIPKERVAVLIGVDGSVKKEIEERMKVKLDIDSQEGDVIIFGEDSLAVYECLNVVRAIGRGFNPEIAKILFDERYMFDLINIQGYVSKSKTHITRIKGRVIGREGMSRKMIEDSTETNIVVYGKTVGIIGKIENVAVAKQAIEMLLEGSPHGNVFKWLDAKKKELIRREFEGTGF